MNARLSQSKNIEDRIVAQGIINWLKCAKWGIKTYDRCVLWILQEILGPCVEWGRETTEECKEWGSSTSEVCESWLPSWLGWICVAWETVVTVFCAAWEVIVTAVCLVFSLIISLTCMCWVVVTEVVCLIFFVPVSIAGAVIGIIASPVRVIVKGRGKTTKTSNKNNVDSNVDQAEEGKVCLHCLIGGLLGIAIIIFLIFYFLII